MIQITLRSEGEREGVGVAPPRTVGRRLEPDSVDGEGFAVRASQKLKVYEGDAWS